MVLGHVPSRDEDDLGEVEFDVEVVIAERVVLRRVEHLEQGRARVAAPVGADLVDLVEHDHRVHRPGVAQRADETTRKGADVRPPVPSISASSRIPPSDMRTNSRPVARAIDSPIDVLPVPGGPISVMAPERRSSTPRSLRSFATGRDVLDDAVLDVVEARVVGVQHLARGSGRRPSTARSTGPRAASRGCG